MTDSVNDLRALYSTLRDTQEERDNLKQELDKQSQLFEDCKEFVAFAADSDTLGSDTFRRAKILLERIINPKPVRSMDQLPVDTLVEVMTRNGKSKRYTTGEDNEVFKAGRTSMSDIVCAEPTSHEKFKVLEQPHPTFWRGGECPVPDWLEVKVWLRSGEVVTPTEPSDLNWVWHIIGTKDIIAYQIMGEKDD